MLSERRKLYENRPPEGAKPARGGVQNGLREASGQLFFASWDRLGRQGRSEAVVGRPWGRSWDACGALGTVLGASWGVPGRSRAPLGGHFGTPQGLIWTVWTLSVAQREIQQKHRILRCFWGCQGLPEGSEIAPKSAREASWTSLGTQDRSGGPKLRYKRPKLAPRVALGPAGRRRASRKSCSLKSKNCLAVQT